MEPGHREPLDQLFKRWLDLLQYPLAKAAARELSAYHGICRRVWLLVLRYIEYMLGHAFGIKGTEQLRLGEP